MTGDEPGPAPAPAAGPGPQDLPVACSLGTHDGPARLRRWQQLQDTAGLGAHRVGHELAVRYRPGAGVRRELEALAALEQQCCPFVAWTVGDEEGAPVLHVTADPGTPDDVAPIAALFGAS